MKASDSYAAHSPLSIPLPKTQHPSLYQNKPVPHSPTCECISFIKCRIFFIMLSSILCLYHMLLVASKEDFVLFWLFFYCFELTSPYCIEGGGGKGILMYPNKYLINWKIKKILKVSWGWLPGSRPLRPWRNPPGTRAMSGKWPITR